MATYIELYDLRANDTLRARVSTALAVKAAAIIGLQGATAKQLDWALACIKDPPERPYLNYLLGKNSALTPAQLQGVTDAVLQQQVDAAVDKFTA